jgi:hypothetical protein
VVAYAYRLSREVVALTATTLLAACRQNPELFGSVFSGCRWAARAGGGASDLPRRTSSITNVSICRHGLYSRQTVAGLIGEDAALDSVEERSRGPKADVLRAASEPVDAIRTGLKVLEHDARRARAAPGHERVQYAEAVRVEPANALRVPVIHHESGKIPQRVQVSRPLGVGQRIGRSYSEGGG